MLTPVIKKFKIIPRCILPQKSSFADTASTYKKIEKGGTIRDVDDFDSEFDCKKLKEATVDKWGTDEEMVTKVLSTLSNAQRLEVVDKYQTMYGENLVDIMKSELGGDYERTVVALMTEPMLYLARELKEAMSGAGTNERVLVEIMCSKCCSELEAIKEAYEKEFESKLQDDLVGDTSGNLRRLMVSLCSANRELDDSYFLDEEKIENDVAMLQKSGEERMGTDESEYNAVFCSRSYRYLQELFRVFEERAGKSIFEDLESEFSGDLLDGLRSIALYAIDPVTFFAKRLHASMDGAGTYEGDLIRIIVSRSEIDLADIKDKYFELYEQELSGAVESEIGGDFKDILLKVIADN